MNVFQTMMDCLKMKSLGDFVSNRVSKTGSFWIRRYSIWLCSGVQLVCLGIGICKRMGRGFLKSFVGSKLIVG